jgi:hypothetical protein
MGIAGLTTQAASNLSSEIGQARRHVGTMEEWKKVDIVSL